MTILSELRGLFADATRRQRLTLAAVISIMLGSVTYGCSWAGAVMGGMVPVKRTVVIKRVVAQRSYPALKDPQDACRGAPSIINKIVVTDQSTDSKKKEWTSWLTLRPAGDDYLVYCKKGGATGDMWKDGDLIRLYGEPA